MGIAESTLAAGRVLESLEAIVSTACYVYQVSINTHMWGKEAG